ncbi:MAG: hypothetical protein ACYCSF_00075 [Acidimicrobiales bacterium]
MAGLVCRSSGLAAPPELLAGHEVTVPPGEIDGTDRRLEEAHERRGAISLASRRPGQPPVPRCQAGGSNLAAPRASSEFRLAGARSRWSAS